MNKVVKNEDLMKNESSIKSYNLEEIKVNSEVENNELTNRNNEETVLLQIPQDDARVEDMVKRFRDCNKVVGTLVAGGG